MEVGLSERLVAKKTGDERSSERELRDVIKACEWAVTISTVEHAVPATLGPQSEGVDIDDL